MAKKVVIVGGVALGPKVACRVRRLDPEAKITVIDKDNLISYGGCGIPYYVGGDINDLEELYSTTSHAIRDKTFFSECKGVNFLTEMEVTSVDRENRKLAITDLKSGETGHLCYDTLVLATGAVPRGFNLADAPAERVVTVANLHQAKKIKNLMKKGRVGKAVVVGGGPIGVELAEALTDLWGVETTLLEQAPRLLSMAIDDPLASLVQRHLQDKGVEVMVGTPLIDIGAAGGTGGCVVAVGGGEIACDLVILSTGVSANSKLAAEAGLSIGKNGGVLVDRRMRTSDPNIYAGGDCAEFTHLVSGEKMMMPLGSLANRQGRIIGSNICGGSSQFKGMVGTFCMKVFDLGVSSAGLTMENARRAGYDPVSAQVAQGDHAHFYPNSELIYLTLIADRRSRKILGVQAVGKNGNSVKARVDTIAVQLEHGISVDEICCLETGYAPPFSSAMDVVNNVGNVLDNILANLCRPVEVGAFLASFEQGVTTILDVRGDVEAGPGKEKYGERWLHIPQPQLRTRYRELIAGKDYSLLCDTGPRAYEAQVFLDSVGVRNSHVIQGGYAMIRMVAPDFV